MNLTFWKNTKLRFDNLCFDVFGVRFEKLCQEWLLHHYQREHILWQHLGQYWKDDSQIDVAAVRKDNWIDLEECKWGAVKSLNAVADDLENKVQHYPRQGGYSIGRHIFLKTHSAQKIANVQIHSLASLFESKINSSSTAPP